MRTYRKFSSLAFVFFWVVLFSFGISQVFLFLQGYNPFSFGKKEIQQGYATFESDHEIFLNNDFLGKGNLYGRYDVGKYSFCAEDLGYSSRCFHNLEVRQNNYSSLEVTDIVLQPSAYRENSLLWTKEPVYFLQDFSAFFWYDSLKKQIFYVSEFSGGVRSYFPSFVPDSIIYDDTTKDYVLKGVSLDGSLVQVSSSDFLPSSFSFLSSFKNAKYSFEDFRVVENNSDYSFLNSFSSRLLGVFDEKKSFIIPIKGSENTLLVFPDSVYIFFSSTRSFDFLIEKDLGTPVFFLDDLGYLFYTQEKSLRSVSIL